MERILHGARRGTRKLTAAVRAENVKRSIGTLYQGMDVFLVSKGQWSLIDALEYLLGQTGPADAVLTTWSMGGEEVATMNRLLRVKGLIRSLRFLVDFSFVSRKPVFCSDLRAAFGDCVRVFPCHAKLGLIGNEDWKLVIRSSMNLNRNIRLEFLEVSDDAELYDFLSGVIMNIWDSQEQDVGFEARPVDNVRAFDRLFRPDGLEAASVEDLIEGVL